MRLEINCQDRLGITQDILDILVEHSIDLRGIEIDEVGKIFLHFPNMEFEEFKHLMPKIRHINGIDDVKTTSFMPGERERYQLSAILKTLPDPVFSIDTKGMVVTSNHAAQSSLELTSQQIDGQDISELIHSISIEEWLDQKETISKSVKVKFIEQDYLADILPVVVPDSAGSILAGAVIILKSETRLGQLLNTFHHHDEKDSFEHFTVLSSEIRKTIKEAKQIADLDQPIIIFGEAGSGKEQLARACHQISRRAEHAFAVIKCDDLSDAAFESELLGYVEGYLGHEADQPGLLGSVGKGTVYFDEISKLTQASQKTLRHLLETGEFNRLGSSKVHKYEARFVCSSTEDLELLVNENTFDEKLYYKINVLSIGMPALRERKQDIIAIAEECIVESSAKLGKQPAKLSKSCVDFLRCYPWPGNVSQLKNTLFRAVALLDGNEITKEHIRLPNCGSTTAFIDENFEGTLDEEVKKFERDLLRKLYPSYPSTRQLAKKLGLSHTAIANKLREYGINKTTIKL